MVEGAVTGWSTVVKRYSLQMDMIENIIECVFLPYWRSQLASFSCVRVSLALAVEKGQLATEAPYVLCESLHCPSSVWVAISQVETARAPPAYSGHVQCSVYCYVAISHCLCPQSLVSQRFIVSMQLPFRLCWDGHIWIWGSLSHALMFLSSSEPGVCCMQLPSPPSCTDRSADPLSLICTWFSVRS